MATGVQRPTFYEGQILGPDDLNGSVDYGRGSLARHERYLHTWGIGTGLELVGNPQTTADGKAYVSVTTKAGMAIDASGRQIVVPDDQLLNEGTFDLINGGRTEPGAWYPVFLVGQDQDVPPQATLAGACDAAASTQVAESFELTFGRLGDELNAQEPTPPAVSAGPSGGTADMASNILLGFVQWLEDISRFAAVSLKPESVGPRYAGVAADEVDARGGVLTLRSRPPTTANKPAVVIDEADGGKLTFGLQDARGNVTNPVLTVTSSGDVTAAGKLSGALTAGVLVESGIATDGVVLPLPSGITQDQVDKGQVVLHIHATPRYDDLSTTPVPVVCVVENQRLRCRFVDPADATKTVPGRADYVVLAYVAPGKGGGS